MLPDLEIGDIVGVESILASMVGSSFVLWGKLAAGDSGYV